MVVFRALLHGIRYRADLAGIQGRSEHEVVGEVDDPTKVENHDILRFGLEAGAGERLR